MIPASPDPAPSGEAGAVDARKTLLSSLPPIPFAVLTLLIVFVLYQLVGGIITYFVMGEMVTEQNVDAARWLTLAGQLVLILVPTIVLAGKRRGSGPGFFPIRGVDLRQISLSIVGVFSLQQVLQGYMLLQERIPLPDELDRMIGPIREMIDETYRVLVTAHSVPEFLFVVLVVAAVPALVEELLFRGLIQGSLSPSSGGMRAAVVTGIVFAAYHLNPFTFIPLAALGIYFGFLVFRTGSLSNAIAAHFTNNFVACALVYLNTDEEMLIFAPSGGSSLMPVLTNSGLFLVIFLASVVMLRRVTAPTISVIGDPGE